MTWVWRPRKTPYRGTAYVISSTAEPEEPRKIGFAMKRDEPVRRIGFDITRQRGRATSVANDSTGVVAE